MWENMASKTNICKMVSKFDSDGFLYELTYTLDLLSNSFDILLYDIDIKYFLV